MTITQPTRGLGWLKETAKSRPILHRAAIQFRFAKAFAEPAEIDHRTWRAKHVRQQANIGSCVGMGKSNGGSVLTCLDTRGVEEEYSAMASYRWAQMEDGITGAQSGAMVSGALKAAKSKGFAREETWPYKPSKYSLTVPAACLEDAKNRKLIGQHAIPRSYDEAKTGLASGAFIVIVGVPWTSSLDGNTSGIVETVSGQVLGGHCFILHGYSSRKDSQGRNYFIMENSHGKQWGKGGFAEVAPSVVAKWIAGVFTQQQNEVILWTDIQQGEEIEPRETDWIEKAWG